MEQRGHREGTAHTKAPSVAVNHSARGFLLPNESRQQRAFVCPPLLYGRHPLMSMLPPARNLPARAGLLNIWIDLLYSQLRTFEARAALPDLRPEEHLAAVASAKHTASQIELYREQVYRLLNPTNGEPPGAGETPRRF